MNADFTSQYPIDDAAREAFVATMMQSPKFKRAIADLRSRVEVNDPGEIVEHADAVVELGGKTDAHE